MSIVEFVQAHYVEIIEVVTGLILVAEVIVKITPTENDDSFVEKVGKVWSKITGLFPSNLKK